MTTPTRSNYEIAEDFNAAQAYAQAQVYATLAVADAIKECCNAITNGSDATREAFAEYVARQQGNQ